jgi:ribonuclease R
VRANGLFIELTESMTFGFISAYSLPDDNYQLSNDQTELVGRRSKRVLALSSHIDVVVDKVDRFKRLIDFRLASDAGKPAAPASPGKRAIFTPAKFAARAQPAEDVRKKDKKSGRSGHRGRR